MNRKWLFLVILLLVIVWVVNTSRPGRQVEGCLDGCASESPVEQENLKVISLNMLHGFPCFELLDERLQIIADGIDVLEPDIVLLQEVPWTLRRGNAAKHIAEQTGMNYAYLRANGNRWAIGFEEGEAILSRFPLLDPAFSTLKPRSGFFENRVVLHARVETNLGDVGLYVTHLTHDNPKVNQGQAETLKAYLQSQEVEFSVVAGDFNALPTSPQISMLKSKWLDVFDGFAVNETGNTCCIDNLDQSLAKLTKRIDYVFVIPGEKTPSLVSRSLVFDTPSFYDEGWVWASDHVGLMALLGLLP